MRSLNLALSFAESLPGRTCIISRFHTPKDVERPPNFHTLHQVAYKVFRKKSTPKDLHNRLAGGEMMAHVRKAFLDVLRREPSQTEAAWYYNLIRLHKNSDSSLLEDPFGEKILTSYQNSLSIGLDWEDGLQNARWILNNGGVPELHQFPYENIILIQPEALIHPRQKNALDFFMSWHFWIEHYTTWNLYVINSDGHISSFANSFLSQYARQIQY